MQTPPARLSDADLARKIVAEARADLGPDLGGGSIVDLLADQSSACGRDWSLDRCRELAGEVA